MEMDTKSIRLNWWWLLLASVEVWIVSTVEHIIKPVTFIVFAWSHRRKTIILVKFDFFKFWGKIQLRQAWFSPHFSGSQQVRRMHPGHTLPHKTENLKPTKKAYRNWQNIQNISYICYLPRQI